MKNEQVKTLFSLFERMATRFSDHEAIIWGKNRILYKEYLDTVNCLANALCLMGLTKGENVAILMPNTPEWAYAHFAAVKIGAPVVGINTRLKAQEIEYILKKSDTTTLFMTDRFLSNDYVSMMYDLIAELMESRPGELNSVRFPSLKRIIVSGDLPYAGMLGFQQVLAMGSRYSSALLEKSLESVQPDDIYGIAFTSGTTGTPKGIVTTHSQFVRSMQVVGKRINMSAKDRILVVSPFNHGMGNRVGMSMAASYGGCMLPMQQFDPGEALRLIEEERVTRFTGSPTMYRMMMNHPDFHGRNTRSIEKCIIGGADVQSKLVEDIRDKMGVRDVINAYGMAETGVMTMTRPEDTPQVISNTSGRFMFQDCEMKIVDPNSGKDVVAGNQGEICVKGWLVMNAYYKMPEETEKALDQDGWFHTGDLGRMDADGNLAITGRHKDMFITGGFNVFPAEVENYLVAHPKIANAAVIGVPDGRLGEVGMAFILLKDGEKATKEEMIAFARASMANYKAPKHIEFIDTLPVTATGKIKKFILRNQAVKKKR